MPRAVHRALVRSDPTGHALASKTPGGSESLGGRRSSLGALRTPRLALHALVDAAVHAPAALAPGRVVLALGGETDRAPGLSPGRLA